MNITEAIVLAGGSGSRLQSTVPGLPKCLAPVNGKPFLGYLLRHLQEQGIENFIFALGVQAGEVIQYLEASWPLLQKTYSIEKHPLGTGGAIFQSLSWVTGQNVFVTNGDTIFKGSLMEASGIHKKLSADCTVLLLPMDQPARYGTVELNEEGFVIAFHEKMPMENGLINAGSYILDAVAFRKSDRPKSFSFEKDYLEQEAGNHRIAASVQEAYFIDIGVPGDYLRAQTEWIYF
jgi:D-glycero-alpha-D-manno-heptose 1-phosphate guanylyltransferase